MKTTNRSVTVDQTTIRGIQRELSQLRQELNRRERERQSSLDALQQAVEHRRIDYVSVREASQRTGLSISYLYELIGKGRIGVHRVGRRYLVLADSLRQYIDPLGQEA